MKTRYPDLFKTASALRGMRDILTHRYGLPGPTVDWSKVWAVFETHLESGLLKELEEAVKQEEDSAEE
jgi:uncharacterized protein with HEPN domain